MIKPPRMIKTKRERIRVFLFFKIKEKKFGIDELIS
jgi:hypothetical protein